jgi:transcriptional regulator with XRE-family HTH domain
MTANTIYERVKIVRKSLKLSQKEFAKRIYLSQSFFGDVEVGKRNLNERIIYLISTQYKVNKEWLKTGKGEMFSTSMTEIKLEHFTAVFSELDELLQDYLLNQANELLKIQKAQKKKTK